MVRLNESSMWSRSPMATSHQGQCSPGGKSDAGDDSDQDGRDPYDTWVDVTPPPRPRIGAYRLLHPIASGAMGDVFRAVSEATGETVALKTIRDVGSGRDTEKGQTLFLREMSVLSRLHHPRIVSIRDFGRAEGVLYLAMEYVKTIDLRQALAGCPVSQQVRLAAGVGCYMLHALDYAHQRSIVHRDIKPANVLVYRNPLRADKIGIKLADFGMSKDTRDAGLSGMTRDGEVRGTPAFMSPDQLANSRDAGPTSDLYSTGAVLYYYLTGMVPHQESPSAPVRLSRILDAPPTPLAHHRADLPAKFCAVIDRALAPLKSRSPSQPSRYGSAIEFNQSLLDFTRKPRG